MMHFIFYTSSNSELCFKQDGGDPVIENQRNTILLTVYSQDGCVDPTIMLVWVQSVVLQYVYTLYYYYNI